MGIQIVPVPRLRDRLGADAQASIAMDTIRVDWDMYMDERFRCRCNFSMAHEVAHFLLHRDYFLWLRSQISSKEEYRTVINNVPDNLAKRIEFQAHDLAGLILVPTHHLRPKYEQLRIEAMQEGYVPEESWDMAIEFMASRLARPFDVSAEMMSKRLGRERDSKAVWLYSVVEDDG